ncbi:MAG: patatin-like phospholipase family protein [Actinomycetota bacterium]
MLSGGASLGSVQVGMAMALYEADVRPDLIFGTSIGAINGAFLASGKTPDQLADVWRRLERSDLFPVELVAGFRGLTGRQEYLVSNRGVTKMLRRHIPFAQIEQAAIPLTVIATEARTGAEVPLDYGPLIPALLASSALPGIFPSVGIHGRSLIDGGVSNNVPITRAIQAGATEVWVLCPGYSCALATTPTSAAAMALHAIALLVSQRLQVELEHHDYPVPVRMVPPPCPITVGATDFSQSAQLIERAYAGTKHWLGIGCPFALPLVPHAHG